MVLSTSSVIATRCFGAQVAAQASSGDVYGLDGDLGTGKTEFVRGFVGEIDDTITVRSPSFSIVNIYSTIRFPVFHFDFYRLGDAEELIEIGFDEYLNGEGVCLVEWAGMFPSVLPAHTRFLRFTDTGITDRTVEFDFELNQR